MDILQLRKEESLTPDMRDVIHMLTIDAVNPPRIVGSFRYKIHEYPSDMDLFEAVSTCCSIETGSKSVVANIQDMIRRIQKRRFTYMSDFKAGVDKRYEVDIGTYHAKKQKLEGYDQYRIVESIANLYTQKLLDKREAAEMIRLVRAKPNAYQHHVLEEALRKRYVLRWTEKEILQGFKVLPLQSRMMLEDAIQQETIVKVDVWALVDDRFMEISNWYTIVAKVDGDNVYLSERPGEYKESLQQDIITYRDPLFRKHMKLAKRMWLYAISDKDDYTVRQLYPLFGSPVAKLYQVQSEMDMLIAMLRKLQSPPYHLIQKQIAHFKTRIGTVPDTYLDADSEKKVFQHLDTAIHGNKNRDKVIQGLEAALSIVSNTVDREALAYIRKNIPRNSMLRKLLHILRSK